MDAVEDSNPVHGFFTGYLVSFGPNQLQGELNEDHIVGYNVYFVNADYEKIGQVVANVPKLDDENSTASESCCVADTYQVWSQDLEIPYKAVERREDLRIMVVPIDTDGVEMPVGMTQEMSADWDKYCPEPVFFLQDNELETCTTKSPR